MAVGAAWAGERLCRRSPRRGEPSARGLDLRFAAFGALLPDLIDKPLAWFGPEDFSDGHTIAHTLAFSLAVLAAGALLARRNDTRLLAVGVGSLTHLAVDPVAGYPPTLLWPAFGIDFRAVPILLPGTYQRPIDAAILVAACVLYLWRDWFRDATRRLVVTGRLSF